MAVSPDRFAAAANLLLCPEDAGKVSSWEELEEEDDDYIEAGGAASSAAAEESEWPPPTASDDDYSATIAALLAAEADHLPCPDYVPRIRARAVDASARHDAVNWILKVNEFYRFRPTTAWLSVNYLDRFLSDHLPPNGKGGWPMQLLSVACVSVAAKMEETHVPPLLDLQILDPPFVFHPRTIRRMELLLATALRWRLRAVTPFDFLHHFAASPALLPRSATALISRASRHVVSTHLAVDFLEYPPSAIAAAALLRAAEEIADSSAGDIGDLAPRLGAWISKEQEVVSRCRQLMQDHANGTCPAARPAKTADQPGASCETGQRPGDGDGDGDPRCSKRRRLGESVDNKFN
ncbi:cyclin-D2-1-like isoform X2 [Zingiber officinale]|uniref:cyclin-D2-1-like isoform X2 n=1 Tax=Zingiber officinale TaxID=94328 RepID=UPI001C4BB7C2|nr:cyclin-D2-1-like isoform X2 [Zingiber officinale]